MPVTTSGPATGGASAGTVDVDRPFASLYDRALSELLTVPVTETWIEMRDGETHVLTAGNPDAPPVVVFQGGNVTNPVTLAWVQSLADEYFLIAPDTPGEPGRRASEPPADYGRWVADVLDALDVDQAAMVGISHGAGVLLEATAHAPDRITAAALVVPAGFGVAPSRSLARVVVPSLAYRLLARRRLLVAAVDPLFTQPAETLDPVVLETVGTALRTGDLAAAFPGPDGPGALAAFDAPTLVVAAEHDPFFPAAWLHPRAAQFLPHATHLTLDDERHFCSPAGQRAATDRIRSFLAEHTA